MSNYEKRVYKVIDGKLTKAWDGPKDGWFSVKADAFADGGPDVAKEAAEEIKEYKPAGTLSLKNKRTKKG